MLPTRFTSSAHSMVMVSSSPSSPPSPRHTRQSSTARAVAILRPKTSNTAVQNSLLAGYIAGVCGTLISYPLDTAKTWRQTMTTGGRHSTTGRTAVTTGASGTRASSTWAAATLSPQTNMWQLTRALYRGIAGPLVTVGLVQSLNFGMYDTTRRFLYARQHATATHYRPDDSSLWHVAVSSATAGTVLAFVTGPLVMVKTKQQVQQISFRQALGQTFGHKHNLTRGFGVHFVSETVGRAIYFVTYEACKRTWMKTVPQHNCPSSSSMGQHIHHNPPSISLVGRMASAGVAGMICWTIMFPLDVVRSRLFASSSTAAATTTTWTMSKRIYQECGIPGFFRGYSISVLRAGPVAAMVLPIYDLTLTYLNQ